MQATLPLLAMFAAASFAQDTRPAFEVASIKLNTSGSGSTNWDYNKGQMLLRNVPMKRLIQEAYHVNPPQVAGPDWIESAHFDVAAKIPSGSPGDQRSQMLRTLLEDRFKLTVHHETRNLNGYSMVIAKRGFKLKPVEGGQNNTDHKGGRIQTLSAKATTMASLAQLLSRYAEAVVADDTGIAGAYDFDLRWTNQDQTAKDLEDIPDIFSAIEETLGLRLQAQKVKADVVVVDHVERVPTEN